MEHFWNCYNWGILLILDILYICGWTQLRDIVVFNILSVSFPQLRNTSLFNILCGALQQLRNNYVFNILYVFFLYICDWGIRCIQHIAIFRGKHDLRLSLSFCICDWLLIESCPTGRTISYLVVDTCLMLTHYGGCESESWTRLRTVKLENCETVKNELEQWNLISVSILWNHRLWFGTLELFNCVVIEWYVMYALLLYITIHACMHCIASFWDRIGYRLCLGYLCWAYSSSLFLFPRTYM